MEYFWMENLYGITYETYLMENLMDILMKFSFQVRFLASGFIWK